MSYAQGPPHQGPHICAPPWTLPTLLSPRRWNRKRLRGWVTCPRSYSQQRLPWDVTASGPHPLLPSIPTCLSSAGRAGPQCSQAPLASSVAGLSSLCSHTAVMGSSWLGFGSSCPRTFCLRAPPDCIVGQEGDGGREWGHQSQALSTPTSHPCPCAIREGVGARAMPMPTTP